jgi:copper transport protein
MSRVIAGSRRLSCALGFLLLPSLAVAHTGLRRSEPAKGSRLTAAPARISLWFTARPQLPFSRIRLTGPTGEVQLDALVADTASGFHADILGAVGPGQYTVHWQTASADGHPIRGEFTFVIAAAGAVANVTTPAPVVRTDTVPLQPAAEHSEYRTARWLEFVALLTVLGALGFRHGVLPPLAARGVPTADAADRARRFGQSALVLYAAAAIVRLYTESAAVNGDASALEPTLLVRVLTGTTWGMGWLFGVVGALLLLVGWRVSKRSVTIGTPLALTGALGMMFSPALSGHAAASRHFVWSVVLDVLHIAAAGLWIGGLLMVLIAGIPAMKRLTNGNQDAAVSALVNSFHPLALFCAPIVIIAGLGTSWIRLGGFSALWPTAYGRTLLLKIALVLLVAGMGTYNSLRARRRLGVSEGTKHLRLTGAIELVCAALVLAVTTVLVSTPVPSEIVLP